MAAKKSKGTIPAIKAFHKEIKMDASATPTELAERIYGDASAKNLKYIGNDASKYVEFLKGKKVPGIVVPPAAQVTEILSNILVEGNGLFNFGDAERRNAMMRERDIILNRLKSESDTKISLSRYKGLGEMNAEQLWETTMDPEKRTLLQVTMDDAEKANEIVTTLMGEEVEPRRNFIVTRAKFVANLDI